MRMQKRQFRIGDLAKQLDVEKFVIRFWEKEFAVNTTRSIGGQRFYSQEDFDTFKQIKTLLYDEGFTIAGAKKQLKSSPMIVACGKTTMQPSSTEIHEQIAALKIQLIKLRELL